MRRLILALARFLDCIGHAHAEDPHFIQPASITHYGRPAR